MSYIIIPDSVKKLKNLNPNAKLIYGDILSLSAQSGYCYANNEYLANIYGFTTRVISKIISQLLTAGIIEIREGNGQYGKGRKIVPLITIDNEQSFHEHRTIVPRTNVPETTNERSNNIEQSFQQTGTNVLKHRNERSTIIDNRIDNIIDNRIDKENINGLKKSKVKKVEEKSKQIYPSNFSDTFINSFQRFLQFRKEIKKPFKSDESLKTKIKQLSNQIEKFGEAIVLESIETAIANGYLGTFIDMKKVEEKKKEKPNHIIPLPEFNVFTGKGIDLTKDPSYCPELGF